MQLSVKIELFSISERLLLLLKLENRSQVLQRSGIANESVRFFLVHQVFEPFFHLADASEKTDEVGPEDLFIHGLSSDLLGNASLEKEDHVVDGSHVAIAV